MNCDRIRRHDHACCVIERAGPGGRQHLPPRFVVEAARASDETPPPGDAAIAGKRLCHVPLVRLAVETEDRATSGDVDRRDQREGTMAPNHTNPASWIGKQWILDGFHDDSVAGDAAARDDWNADTHISPP